METAALRRSDDLKTALLRAVSHDLRTPLTAIVTAGHALGCAVARPTRSARELSAAVVDEGERLSRADRQAARPLATAGRARPSRSRDWISIEEVLLAAREALPVADADVRRCRRAPSAAGARRCRRSSSGRSRTCSRTRWRYSSGQPVSVRARAAGGRRRRAGRRSGARDPARRAGAHLRAVLPRRRDRRESRRTGSGLGLAIAQGFVEANGGTHLRVESLPGQGTSFVVELPLEPGDGASPRCRHAAVRASRASPRLRRRAADPARAEGHAARRRLRGGARGHREEALDAAAVRPAGRGDRRPRAARRRRRRGVPPAARVERDADHRALGGRRGGRRRCARSRPAPTTTSPSRSARAS